MYRLRYDDHILTDLKNLDRATLVAVERAIKLKIIVEPDLYGKPMRTPLAGYRSIRVGWVRVVYRAEKGTVTVLIVGNRDSVYAEALKRLK